MQTCQLTDKSDVYSFGVVLLELITGKKALSLQGPESERSLAMRFLCALKEGRLMDVVDGHVKGEENVGLLEEVADLARQCLEMAGQNRPAMREVAERLDRLRKVMQHPWTQRDPEEMESLLGARESSPSVGRSALRLSPWRRALVYWSLGDGSISCANPTPGANFANPNSTIRCPSND
jgi:serine/threonine protein kinase